jgi:hypothetical protein
MAESIWWLWNVPYTCLIVARKEKEKEGPVSSRAFPHDLTSIRPQLPKVPPSPSSTMDWCPRL